MAELTEAALAEEEEAQEGGFEEERKDPLHGEGLPDDAARGLGEVGPVRPELKLHRDPGHDAEGEVDPEDLRPEPGRDVVTLVTAAKRDGLQDQGEESEPHRELGKEVVKCDGEREMKPVYGERFVHGPLPGQ